MTGAQFYLLAVLPLAGILLNVGFAFHLSARMDRMGDHLIARFDELAARVEKLRFT